MRVCLIYCGIGVAGFNPNHPEPRPWGDREGSWLPHGIASVAASTIEAGHDVDVIDLRQLGGWDHLGTILDRSGPHDAYGLSISSVDHYSGLKTVFEIKTRFPDASIAVGGIHPTIFPGQYDFDAITTVIQGEGESSFCDWLQIIEKKESNTIPKVIRGWKPNLDSIPWVARERFDYERELRCNFAPDQKTPSVTMLAGRGCFYKCLTGDTQIHTMDGISTIRDLVGKNDVRVLTRDPETQKPIYAKATRIWKTQENAPLVRVAFDDGSHIDCTPDHKFKVFKSKNQYIGEAEWDVEAQHLLPKQQVRAVRFDSSRTGRVIISTKRDIKAHRARIVMEAVLGRDLKSEERVHHKDYKQSNDDPENLVLVDNHTHIPLCHPEVSERMRTNNPAKNMTDEWKKNISAAVTGEKRTLETRLKQRETKLGELNPMYKDNPKRRRSYASRIPDVNHKVVSVEALPYTEDVYCMEVPGINWFYANKVLVHNCSYCQPAENAVFGKPYRMRSPENVIAELSELHSGYKFKSITFWDDTFTFRADWIRTFCDLYEGTGIRASIAACSRADIICRNEGMIERLADVGLDWFVIGMESGSQRLLDLIQKGTTVEHNMRAADVCRKYGIKVFATYMYGLPTESKEETLATARMIDAMQPEFASPFWYTPIPGTGLYDYCVEHCLLLNDNPDLSIQRTGVFMPHLRGIDYEFLKDIMHGQREGFKMT